MPRRFRCRGSKVKVIGACGASLVIRHLENLQQAFDVRHFWFAILPFALKTGRKNRQFCKSPEIALLAAGALPRSAIPESWGRAPIGVKLSGMFFRRELIG